MFPNKTGKYGDYFGYNDILDIYVGIDLIDIKGPLMTGLPYEFSGRTNLTVSVAELSSILAHSYRTVDDYDNFDGFEASLAIKNLIEEMDMSMYYKQIDTDFIKPTNPRIVLDDSFRFSTPTSRLELIKNIRSRCYDDQASDTNPLLYTFWMTGNKFNFQKMLPLSEDYAYYNFENVDDLLASRPTSSVMPLLNKATVQGKQYTDVNGIKRRYTGSFTLNSSVDVVGLHEKTFADNTLTSNWECQQKAARIVMASPRFRVTTSQVMMFDLISSIPDFTQVMINDSKYGLSGVHRVSELTVNAGGGNSRVLATLNNVNPVLTDYI